MPILPGDNKLVSNNIFKMDMTNALNSQRPDVFLSAARESRGSIQDAWQVYSGPTNIFCDETDLVLATGIQQRNSFRLPSFSIGIGNTTWDWKQIQRLKRGLWNSGRFTREDPYRC